MGTDLLLSVIISHSSSKTKEKTVILGLNCFLCDFLSLNCPKDYLDCASKARRHYETLLHPRALYPLH